MRNTHATVTRWLPARLAAALLAGTLLVGIAACNDDADELEEELDEEFDDREDELEEELEDDILD